MPEGKDNDSKLQYMIEKLLEPLVSERFRNEEKYRFGHTRILNPLPGRAVMGLHIPDMRKVAKTLAVREDASTIIADFGKEAEKGREALAHEELMVWGMMINFIKGAADEKLAMLEKFVPQIDSWGVCDSVAPGARWFRKADKAWDILCRYFASDREFEVRFATVMSMCHFMDERYLPRIFWQFDALDFNRIRSDYLGPSETRAAGGPEKVLSSGRGVVIGESPYYVRMGVAWCLATALAKFPDETRGYLRHSCLPEDVLKLYARKARESFRTRDISPF